MPRDKSVGRPVFASHIAADSTVVRWNFFSRVPNQNSRNGIVGSAGPETSAVLWDETPLSRDEWQDEQP